MKIIDLLNKIANDKLENTKFIYDGTYYQYFDVSGDIYEYHDKTYEDGRLLANDDFNISNLNDEVEIIEEPKKIKKIEFYKNVNDISLEQLIRNVNYDTERICDKINEMIDKLNKEVNKNGM